MIYRKVSNYPAPHSSLNTTSEQSIRCRKIDLYRSIITVGNPSFLSQEKIRAFGFIRTLNDSVLSKAAIVAANIQSDSNGIRRHPIFDSYVSDQKRLVSYNLGMAFAKFYSEKLLKIPNLVHVEFLKKQGAISFVSQANGARPREPDLVGQSNDGNWHVFEAKGISNPSHLNGKIKEAKLQLSQVNTIYGAQPQTRSACATYIGLDRILSYLEDPPKEGEKQFDIIREKFLESYYAPFLLAGKLDNSSPRRELIDGLEVEFYDLKGHGPKLSIGLYSEIAELLRENKYELPQSITRELALYASRDSDKYSIGLDGLVVSYTNFMHP